MKLSLAATLLILSGAAWLGWRNQGMLANLREQQQRWLVEADRAGLSGDAILSHRSSGRTRESAESRKASLREFARTLVEFSRNFAKPGGPSNEDWILHCRMHDVLLRINADDARVVLERIHSLPDHEGNGLSSPADAVIILLSQSRPSDAIALARETALLYPDDGFDAESSVLSCLQGWAKRDPLAAAEWLRRDAVTHPDLLTTEVKRGVIGPVARIDPALAFRLAGEFGLPLDEALAREFGASPRTQTERENVLASMRGFIATVADVAVRDRISSTFVSEIFENARNQGFDQATQWLETEGLSTAEVAAVISKLNHSSFDDTGRWLEWMGGEFPEQSGQGINRLVKSWTESDYPAATAWLESAPEGPLKRQATVIYAETVARYHPAEAARWALTLDQGEERTRVLERIHGAWKQKDEAAAAAFARQHGIAE